MFVKASHSLMGRASSVHVSPVVRHLCILLLTAILVIVSVVEAMALPSNEKYAFVFAHPDDDVMISGTMKMLIDKGAEVHGVWLGSGDFIEQGPIRRAELEKAAQILGLKKSRIHMLHLKDGRLVEDMEHGATLLADLFAKIKPENVFVTAFEGGHPDHDVANFLAYEASRRAGIRPKLYEFPLYNGSGPAHHWWWRINDFPPGGPPVLSNPLNRAAVETKYRIMRNYSSQWMYMLPARLASTRSDLLKMGEPYRLCPWDRDHTVRPHPGMLNYERWFNRFLNGDFEKFSDAVRKTRQAPPEKRDAK
jgi:LmbE family N-acetylglucosaminyl deacetylase